MTTAFLLVALLAHGTGASDWPTISLELHAAVPPARPTPGSWAELDELMTASSKSGPPVVELSLTVRANRAGDVRFDQRALTLEIQDLAGKMFPQKPPDRLEPAAPNYVRLRAGQTMRLTLRTTGRCGAGVPGYAVVGVFTGDDGNFPFRLPPHDGATLVTRRVESNRIVIRCPTAARR